MIMMCFWVGRWSSQKNRRVATCGCFVSVQGDFVSAAAKQSGPANKTGT
jgi:hypothetical protein